MGYLENGVWQRGADKARRSGGAFARRAAQFRNWVTADGSPGPSGEGGFEAAPGRYHLYISYACPWAHRTLIFRRLKGLEQMVSLSVAHWFLGPDGWSFDDGDGVVPDSVNHARFLREVYVAARPDYTGRVSVPLLWDKERRTIVSNESSQIIRMFNTSFDRLGAHAGDYYPLALRGEIDALNERIYRAVNNGVYRAGFATTQEAYEEAVGDVFAALEWLEERLAARRYLTGDAITEADWRLFTTLVRFDPVYVGHFKCNLRRLADYPNLSGYLGDLYQQPGIAGTVRLDHIKAHYYRSHTGINPLGIVPLGPVVDFAATHGRDRGFAI